MAFSTVGANFELRTGGSDSNGGGCMVKTRTWTLKSDGSGNVGMGSLSAGGFVAGDVGHTLIIYAPPTSAAGWTSGAYTINSVNGATGVATLSSNPGPSLSNGRADLCPGVDYTQQNAAQYTFADLASTNGNTGSPTVTSASHAFVGNDVGNIMQITAGTNWAAGFYQIVSVAAGAATLDRACGSVAALTAGTYAVGGALLTPAKAATALIAANNTGSNNALGSTLWIKSGTYTVTAEINWANASFPRIVGFDANRGDDTGTKPTITTTTVGINLMHINSIGVTFFFDNIIFSNTSGGTRGNCIYNSSAQNTVNLTMRRCRMTGFGTAVQGDNSGNNWQFKFVNLIDCEIDSCSANSVNTANPGDGVALNNCTSFRCFGCYFHNNDRHGVNVSAIGDINLEFSIFDSNGQKVGTGGNGAVIGGNHGHAENCNFTNNTRNGGGNNGFGLTLGSSSPDDWSINNCIFYGNSNDSFVSAVGHFEMGYNNAFDAVGTAYVDGLLGKIILTTSPFISSSNFALNTTAGGGALLIGAAYPGPFGSSTTSSFSVGAVQPASAAPAATPTAFAYFSR